MPMDAFIFSSRLCPERASEWQQLGLISNNSAIICSIQSKSEAKAEPLLATKGPAQGV